LNIRLNFFWIYPNIFHRQLFHCARSLRLNEDITMPPNANSTPTGLSKKCPRCERLGEVFREPDEGEINFEIRWQRTEEKESHVDKGVTIDQLISPLFGCGDD